MTDYPMTSAAARTVLDAVIKEQLAKAYQRGMDAAPHGVNADADPDAISAFGAIAVATDSYATAIIDAIVQSHPVPDTTDGT